MPASTTSGQRVWVLVNGVDTSLNLRADYPIELVDDIKRLAALQANVPITYHVFVDGNEVKPKDELEKDKLAEAKIEFLLDGRLSQFTPMHKIVNLHEFQTVAKAKLDPIAYDYITTGAEDESTLDDNAKAFLRYYLRPHVMVDVDKVDTSCTILGHKYSMPIMVAPAALGKLLHKDGEHVTVGPAGKAGVLQVASSFSSLTLEEIISIKTEGQTLWFQLYVNGDRKKSEDMIRRAEAAGYSAICVTVDAPMLGRRERDLRNKAQPPKPVNVQKDQAGGQSAGLSTHLTKFIDPSLDWDDIAWLRSITSLPLVIKGIQTAEDAQIAVDKGLEGIVVSNHGGRQLDGSRAALDILPEVVEVVRKSGKNCEVFVDGGVRRGTDILKALALGAKAVLIGRPILYAAAAYGPEGVTQCFAMIKRELEVAMSLSGLPSLDKIDRTYVWPLPEKH